MAETKNTTDPAGNSVPQPGVVVTPNASGPPPEASNAAAEPAIAPPSAAPAAPEPQPAPQPVDEQPQAQPEPINQSSVLDAESEPAQDQDADDQAIAWTASEFVAHDKSAGWYFLLTGVTALVAALVFLITKDKISVSVVVVAGIIMGVYGARQPRQLEYRINQRGIGIQGKYHNYDEFRSFSVVPEGAFASIVFMPLKRFGVPVTIYYAPDDEDKILALLSDQLPFEEHRADAVDRLMRRIRF
jgi:hypothetical protein